MRLNYRSSRPGPATARAVCSVLFAGIVAGCATPELTPVADPAVRVEGSGFSVLPPPGTGWNVEWKVIGGSRALVFFRQGSPGSLSHTVAVSAHSSTVMDPGAVGFPEYANDMEVFAAYIKKSTEVQNPPGGRTLALQHTVVPDTRHGHCAMEYAKWEDRGSKVVSGVLIQQDWQLACLHPDSAQVIIALTVSERGHSGETDPTLAAAREAFFDSLQFRPLK